MCVFFFGAVIGCYCRLCVLNTCVIRAIRMANIYSSDPHEKFHEILNKHSLKMLILLVVCISISLYRFSRKHLIFCSPCMCVCIVHHTLNSILHFSQIPPPLHLFLSLFSDLSLSLLPPMRLCLFISLLCARFQLKINA